MKIILFIIVSYIYSIDDVIVTNQIQVLDSVLNGLNYEDLVILDLFDTLIFYEYDIFNKENKANAINNLKYKLGDINAQKEYTKIGIEKFCVDQRIINFISKIYKKDIKIIAISDKKTYKNGIFKKNAFNFQDKKYIDGIYYYYGKFKFYNIPLRVLEQYKVVVLITANKILVEEFIRFCKSKNIKYRVVLYENFRLKKNSKEIDDSVNIFLKQNIKK